MVSASNHLKMAEILNAINLVNSAMDQTKITVQNVIRIWIYLNPLA